MAYTSNPHVGKARKLATNWVKKGMSKAGVARKFGVHRSTIGKWMKKATKHSLEQIRTVSSRPHSHPQQLPQEVVDRIVAIRLETKRCAQIVHAYAVQEGLSLSLSSVKRIFKRYKLTKPSKRRQIQGDMTFKRPKSDKPGALVQVDTIHFVAPHSLDRFYVYAVIDTYSRLAYAEFQPSLSSHITLSVIERALERFTFPVEVIQTDNGPEFSEALGILLKDKGIRLRHTRVRKPNDNAHVERFIRTIQEECFDCVFPDLENIESDLYTYLEYYNFKRLHLGIQCKTPSQMLPSS